MSSHLRTAVLDATSAVTVVDHDEKPQSALSSEKYVKNDIEDPPPPLSNESNEDPNLVTWDGPNDIENPQNWSRRYKWIITIICSIMTVNV